MPTIADAYPYQLEGIDFLLRDKTCVHDIFHVCEVCRHALLNDEQGLGKTIQVLLAIQKAKIKSALIVCPKGVKIQWLQEAADWGVSNKVNVLSTHNPPDFQRFNDDDIVGGLYVCHYQQLQNKDFLLALHKAKFELIVVDEIQRCKSIDSITSLIILGKRNFAGRPLTALAYRRWFLTGTWMPNRAIELFPLLASHFPGVIKGDFKVKEGDRELVFSKSSFEGFGRYFCNGFPMGQGQWNFRGTSNEAELRERIESHGRILRREVEQVQGDLPPVVERKIFLEVDMEGIALSNSHMATVRREIGLRKFTVLYLFLCEALTDNPDCKYVVFCQTRDLVIELQLAMCRTFDAVCIHGQVSENDRIVALDSFKNIKSCRILFAQQDCLAEGINGLQKVCNHIVYAEEEWSDGKRKQTTSRIRRDGQTETTFVDIIHAFDPNYDDKILDEIMHNSRNKKTVAVQKLFAQPKQKEGIMLEEIMKELSANLAALKELNGRMATDLGRIATALEKGPSISLGNATALDAAGNPITPKPADKPAGNDKPAVKPSAKAKPQDKPAPTTTAQTVEQQGTNPDIEELKTEARAALNRLKDKYTAENAHEDPEAPARQDLTNLFAKYKAKNVLEIKEQDRLSVIEQLKLFGSVPVAEVISDDLGLG